MLTRRPVVDDLQTKLGTAYGSAVPAALAKFFGSATKVDNDHGGHNGEWGSTINGEHDLLGTEMLHTNITFSR